MRIFSHTTWPPSAITEYRTIVPLTSIEKYCNEHGKPVDIVIDEFHPSTTPSVRLINFHAADIVQVHAAIAVQMYETISPVKVAIPSWNRETGDVKTTPAYVLDLDDLYHEVGYTNPSFGFWGVHRPDGSMMEDGDAIKIQLNDGGEVTLWEDGKEIDGGRNKKRSDVFSVASNHKRMANLERLIREADMVTLSTKRLKYVLENKFGLTANWFVYPNSVSVKEWEECGVDVKDNPNEVRIMWQGGWSHADDMLTIRDSVAKLAHKYPNTKWILFGHRFKWFESAIPEKQLERVDWVQYEAYKLKLNSIGADINLAPLADTTFNACKSAIKWYEASMTKKRSATIASRVGPFSDEMVDGETGMLFGTAEEFEAKMEILIQNAELRRKLADNAYEWVKANRSILATTPKLYDAYEATSEFVKKSRRSWKTRNKENSIGLLSANNFNVGSG